MVVVKILEGGITKSASQSITLKSPIFPAKNANLQSFGLVGLVANSSDFKTRQFL